MAKDMIEKPSHYQGKHGLEAIEVARNFIGGLVGIRAAYWFNALKYLLRFQKKNGLEEMEKDK